MIEDVGALMNELPPELIDQLLGLSTMDEKDALLQQQMSMAEALRQQPQRRSTPLGAALEGLGGVVSNVGATIRGNNLLKEREALLKDKLDARKGFAGGISDYQKRLADALRAQQAADAQQRAQYDAMSVDPVAMMTR